MCRQHRRLARHALAQKAAAGAGLPDARSPGAGMVDLKIKQFQRKVVSTTRNIYAQSVSASRQSYLTPA
jgi:hypothetical protein